MTTTTRRLSAATGTLAVLGVLLACSSSKPGATVTVTVPASRASSGLAAASTSPGSGATSTPASPTATHLRKLNGTCDTLLPGFSITQALGGRTLAGATAFVVGQPEPTIGRIGYLNCRYGVTGRGAAANAKLEIGLSLYSTAARATARVGATVDDYTAHGATAADTKVAGRSGTMLTGGAGTGYDVPLLVVASGQRTVAVNVARTLATGAKATSAAVAVAALALNRSGG